MNNYILFDKVLKCSVVEDASKHNLIFKKWKRKFKYHDKYQNYLVEKNKFKSKEEVKEHVKLLLEKEEHKRKKLSDQGIKYDFPGFVIFENLLIFILFLKKNLDCNY
jgi:nucleolar protein 15